jgi:hypothetical protein
MAVINKTNSPPANRILFLFINVFMMFCFCAPVITTVNYCSGTHIRGPERNDKSVLPVVLPVETHISANIWHPWGCAHTMACWGLFVPVHIPGN